MYLESGQTVLDSHLGLLGRVESMEANEPCDDGWVTDTAQIRFECGHTEAVTTDDNREFSGFAIVDHETVPAPLGAVAGRPLTGARAGALVRACADGAHGVVETAVPEGCPALVIVRFSCGHARTYRANGTGHIDGLVGAD